MGKTRPQREMGYRFGTAGLVEADQVKSKVLDPVEQAVEFAVVSGWEDQARAAVAGSDRDIAGQPFRQGPAFAAHDELIPVAGLAELGGHGQPSVPGRQ
jgi:hypothetical protein